MFMMRLRPLLAVRENAGLRHFSLFAPSCSDHLLESRLYSKTQTIYPILLRNMSYCLLINACVVTVVMNYNLLPDCLYQTFAKGNIYFLFIKQPNTTVPNFPL